MKNLFLILACSLLSAVSFAQTCIGKWTTIDDNTGKKKSIVELYKDGEVMYGKITYLYPREGREDNPTCKVCTDDRKGKPLVGLQIVRGLKWNGSAWEGGTILDPETGKVYKAKIWINGDDNSKLNVRGYVGPLFRTQTWVKEK